MSTKASWPIRDGDRVGRGRESERLDRGNRPKKTGETVDRRQNNGNVKAVSPRHCPATCALRNCSFNCVLDRVTKTMSIAPLLTKPVWPSGKALGYGKLKDLGSVRIQLSSLFTGCGL